MYQRYYAEICFNGTNYHGWQIQTNALSVQETVNKALSTILNDDITTSGAGRTDTGVHAKQFFIHFDTKSTLSANSLFKINNFLPQDIAVKQFYLVPVDAHARFDAICRTYQYMISKTKNPFLQNFICYNPYDLDLEKMNTAAKFLLKHKEFRSFCNGKAGNDDTTCIIKSAKWEKTKGGAMFTISANRFLRGMVRIIVGTLIKVGRNHISIHEFKTIMEARHRPLAAKAAPACGLHLISVKYPFKLKPLF